jgi:hypothetical protein
MWVYVLFITVTFFDPSDGLTHIQTKALNVFPTMEACVKDKEALIKVMAESYPGESDYQISCERRQKIDPQTKQPLLES